MRNLAVGNKEAEKQVLEDALREFEALTGVAAVVEKRGVTLPGGADALVRLGGDKLLVEIKKHVNPTTLGPILAQLGQLPKPGLLVTTYVTPPMAERLKQQEIAFLDTAGNAYLRTRNTFFFITGRKPAAHASRGRGTRVFRATGLRVIFALLCLPQLADAPYREIAQKAGVALGSVNIILKELEQLGFLQITKARGRVLIQRERLMNTWVEAYARELRPRLHVRRFQVETRDWWKDVDFAALQMWLGGEPAAALLTRYLRPEKVTLYGATRLKDLAARIRPVKDEHGNLELLDPFWHFDIEPPLPGHQLVPPLLVYADLVATADERNLETAALIKERYLG